MSVIHTSMSITFSICFVTMVGSLYRFHISRFVGRQGLSLDPNVIGSQRLSPLLISELPQVVQCELASHISTPRDTFLLVSRNTPLSLFVSVVDPFGHIADSQNTLKLCTIHTKQNSKIRGIIFFVSKHITFLCLTGNWTIT